MDFVVKQKKQRLCRPRFYARALLSSYTECALELELERMKMQSELPISYSRASSRPRDGNHCPLFKRLLQAGSSSL